MSLAASVLIKYISAPLFILDILHLLTIEKRKLRDYFWPALAVGIFFLVTFGLFYRSPEFFSYLTLASQWHFYSPREAVMTLQLLFGRLPFVEQIARSFFLIIALYLIFRYLRKPELVSFRLAVLGLMSGLLFSVSSHVWPWYLIWVLPLAAVVPGSMLTRWVLGVALATPFPILMWTMYGDMSAYTKFDLPALFLYTFATMFVLLAPRHLFPSALDEPDGPGEIEGLQGTSNRSLQV